MVKLQIDCWMPAATSRCISSGRWFTTSLPKAEAAIYGSVREINFLQILNVYKSHWISVSNIDCGGNTINVYDSAYATLDLDTKMQICSIWRPKGDYVTINMMNIQLMGLTVVRLLLRMLQNSPLGKIP